jgi:hypothetical protein
MGGPLTQGEGAYLDLILTKLDKPTACPTLVNPYILPTTLIPLLITCSFFNLMLFSSVLLSLAQGTSRGSVSLLFTHFIREESYPIALNHRSSRKLSFFKKK